jgi:hypothetical protein
MAKTTNKYWIYLENLRRSGVVNMFGATPYIMDEFDVDKKEARDILMDWMNNYNPDDYEEEN